MPYIKLRKIIHLSTEYNIIYMIEWTLVEDDMVYEIHTFDDGNECYRSYTNQWSIIATWESKVKLMNTDGNTYLFSISRWKIRELNVEPPPTVTPAQ